MKKAILCISIFLLCGCQATSQPTITYDCAEADKPTISDFVIKCVGQPIPLIDSTREYNTRLDNCTEKAMQLFCRPITSRQDNQIVTP